jgi:hypothetical protein
VGYTYPWSYSDRDNHQRRLQFDMGIEDWRIRPAVHHGERLTIKVVSARMDIDGLVTQ